jgi:hypothetical protein
MRGKVGDKVFGLTRYGSFIRQAPVRTKPFTPSELSSQETFALLSPVWTSLEDSQRDVWIRSGRDRDVAQILGNTKIKAGWNLFHSVNLKMLSAGLPIIRVFNSLERPQKFNEISIGIEKIKRKKALILDTKPGIEENTVLVIYATRGMSPGIMSINPNEYKIIASVGHSTITMSGSNKIDLTECYEKKYGRLPINGQKVGFEIKPLNSNSAVSDSKKTVIFTYRDAAESAISKQ